MSCSHSLSKLCPRFEVADIFQRFWKRYLLKYELSIQQLNVMQAIRRCRTRLLGYHEDECDHCGHLEYYHNSCRDRHCPKCQGSARLKWLSARLEDLLPVPYFHVVFTLPHCFNPLLSCNKFLLYDLLFKKAAETLLEFAQTPKHLGAKPGFIGVLCKLQ